MFSEIIFPDLTHFTVKTDFTYFCHQTLHAVLITGTINQQNSEMSQRCSHLSRKRMLFTKKSAAS